MADRSLFGALWQTFQTMMRERRALRVECPICRAAPWMRCEDVDGYVIGFHAERARRTDRLR